MAKKRRAKSARRASAGPSRKRKLSRAEAGARAAGRVRRKRKELDPVVIRRVSKAYNESPEQAEERLRGLRGRIRGDKVAGKAINQAREAGTRKAGRNLRQKGYRLKGKGRKQHWVDSGGKRVPTSNIKRARKMSIYWEQVRLLAAARGESVSNVRREAKTLSDLRDRVGREGLEKRGWKRVKGSPVQMLLARDSSSVRNMLRASAGEDEDGTQS